MLELDKIPTKNNKIIKLRVVKDLLEAIDALNKINKKISIIHPNLIFHDPDKCRYVFMDVCFEEITKKIDIKNNFHIINYLGFYDYDKIYSIYKGYESVYKDKNSNILHTIEYCKTDLYGICTLLCYLFSITDRSNPNNNFSYESILLALQKDFYSTNYDEFEHLQKLVDNFIFGSTNTNKFYIKGQLKKLWESNASIVEFKQEFIDKYQDQNNKEICVQCLRERDKNPNQDHKNENPKKELNCKTLEFLCITHLKINEVSNLPKDIKIEKFKAKIVNLNSMSMKIPQLEDKKFTEFFNFSLKDVINDIGVEQEKFGLTVKHKENELNNLLNYINNLLNQKNEQLKNEMLEEINNCESKFIKNDTMSIKLENLQKMNGNN